MKNHQKIKDHCDFTGKYRGAAYRFNVPREIPVVFHNSSNSDYHFVIKELVKEFKEYFECLGENYKKKKYKNFSVPIEEEI